MSVGFRNEGRSYYAICLKAQICGCVLNNMFTNVINNWYEKHKSYMRTIAPPPKKKKLQIFILFRITKIIFEVLNLVDVTSKRHV
jgi:hypothetical protein